MKYENLLASRYIKAQKMQSVFTAVSIAAAVAVITMIFVLYSVCMNCLENTYYSEAPYHLVFNELTEEQGEAIADFSEVRSVKLSRTPDGVSAYVLFGSDIGDRELWLQNAAKKIGALQQYERSKNDSMHGAYEWNDNLMQINGIGDSAHLFKLRIFCIFFIFAVLIAFALRLIIDTAFEVSSKERERHYGVLQSIGATPEQIVRIITYEGLRLCIVGVPFGLLAGIGFAYLMYTVLLAAGLSEIFQGMTSAKLYLPFSVDPKMLLVAAVIGIVWVFLSAYGVGMRIIKKTPMKAIINRSDKVEKVRKRTLSGMLFGILGSIASRNAKRQKKRFFITVMTLTVSITLFSLFSTLTETAERSINGYIQSEICSFDEGTADIDFEFGIGNFAKGISITEAENALADSGLFENISVQVYQALLSGEDESLITVYYINREAYTQIFGADAPISYDELVISGGYVYNANCKNYAQYADELQSGSLSVFSIYSWLPEDADKENMSHVERRIASESEKREHTLDILGSVAMKNENNHDFCLYGAIETLEKIESKWFGEFFGFVTADFSFARSSADNYQYNAADLKKAQKWFKEHSDFISPLDSDDMEYESFYGIKWRIHSILASLRAGVLIFNFLIALAALINLMNIISTGIANRRSELASLQCIGMTDKQLDRMAIIECLQFAGTAAIISALICTLMIFSVETALQSLVNASLDGTESKETRKMLLNIVRIDHLTPFMRIGLASLTAFAAGCITSLIMLRTQNTESLSDQIRGSELKFDTKKSHVLRNSVIAVAAAFVLVIAGLRIYSVVSWHNDRNEYAKAGYLNLVESNGFKMNVYSTGAEHGKHTIVGLAGMDVNSFPIVTTKLNERLGKENTLVYPDRAGYGFSDDSLKSQTLEQVVEDYRTGLKNAGFSAPYVLMGHSYGDFYALWWQIKYPDEVEAIIFLDGTWLEKNEFWESSTIDEFPSESAAYAEARRAFLRSWLGLDRLLPVESGNECRYGKSLFSEEQLALWDMTEYPEWSAALLSELANESKAANELREILQPTNTPKLYFSTMYTGEEDIREYMEFQKADYEASGLEYKLNIETAAKAEWKRDALGYQDIYKNTLTPFLEKCGNYRLISIGGDHGLFFAQKPDEVANEILNFLAETTE